MTSLFSWIKECFNYVFSGQVKTELVSMINGFQLDTNTRESLIHSIMTDNPKQLAEQISESNLPKNNKDELMMSIMRASQMYVNPNVTELKEIKKVVKEVAKCEIPVEEPMGLIYIHEDVLIADVLNEEINRDDFIRNYENGNNDCNNDNEEPPFYEQNKMVEYVIIESPVKEDVSDENDENDEDVKNKVPERIFDCCMDNSTETGLTYTLEDILVADVLTEEIKQEDDVLRNYENGNNDYNDYNEFNEYNECNEEPPFYEHTETSDYAVVESIVEVEYVSDDDNYDDNNCDDSDDDTMPPLEPAYPRNNLTRSLTQPLEINNDVVCEYKSYTPVMKFTYENENNSQFSPISANVPIVKYYEPEYVSIKVEDREDTTTDFTDMPALERPIYNYNSCSMMKNWRKSFNLVLNQLRFKKFIQDKIEEAAQYKEDIYIRNVHEIMNSEFKHNLVVHEIKNLNKSMDDEVIHTGKIIPSEQFVPVERPRYYNLDINFRSYCSMMKNWNKSFDLVLNQLKFKQFIKEKRAEAKKYKEDIKIHETHNTMNIEFKFNQVVSEMNQINKVNQINNEAREIKKYNENELVVVGKSCFKEDVLRNKRDERKRLMEELKPYTKDQQNRMHSRKHHSPIAKLHRRNNAVKSDNKWKQDM